MDISCLLQSPVMVYLHVLLSALGCNVEHAIPEGVVSACRPLHNLVFALLISGSLLRFLSLVVGSRLLGRHDDVESDWLTSRVVFKI